MDTNKLDRIKRKIAKLMALAHNTKNEHEAESAMRKAAALMASFHVSEGDLEKAEIVKRVKYFKGNRKTCKSAEKLLYHYIGNSLGVYSLYRSSTRPNYWNPDGEPCRFTLVGYEADIEVSWYLFETCLNQIKQQVRAYRQDNPDLKRTAYNDYEAGLCTGLCKRFIKLSKTEVPEGKGLVPVDARVKDAEQWYLDEGNTVSKGRGVAVRNNRHSQNGHTDSAKIQINQGVSTTQKGKQALLT